MKKQGEKLHYADDDGGEEERLDARATT